MFAVGDIELKHLTACQSFNSSRKRNGLKRTQHASDACGDGVTGTFVLVVRLWMGLVSHSDLKELALYSGLRKITIRLEFVPFRLFEMPQQFAVLVKI